MKEMSIRKRVTWYYSLVLIAITVLVFGVFIVTVDLQSAAVSKNSLVHAVQNSFDDIENEHGTLEIDDDFDSYYKGVTLLIYSEDGDLIKGSVPSTLKKTLPLESGKYRKVETDSDTWLVYDLYNSYENGQGIWIRGIYAMDNSTATLRSVILVMLVILPLLLLLAILAGRRITGKAFAPVSEITAAASSIGSGSDLSRRLPLGSNKDELYYLTETLNEMISRLENAFKAEKQFTSDVSHELRTPITVILSEAEVMLKENHQAEEYRESMEHIRKQCRHTMAMIQQLLQLSRTMDRNAVIEREHMDLSGLCKDVVDEFAASAADKGIAIDSSIAGGVYIDADQTLIMRMLVNLISNAIKYNSPSGRVMVSLKKEKENTVIAVSDNGIGIAPLDQENIFNRFYKVDRSRTSDDDSFGLGLAMVKWIAEVHGGHVSLESTKGEGSTFTVTL